MKTKKKGLHYGEPTNFRGFGQSGVSMLRYNLVIIIPDIMVTGRDKGLKSGTVSPKTGRIVSPVKERVSDSG